MYASATETVATIPGLKQNAGSITTALVTMMESVGDGVMGFIDGYVGRRYSVPFGGGTVTGAIPPTIRDIAIQLTAYRTFRNLYSRDSVNENAWIAELKTDALDALKEIRDGKIDLFSTSGAMLTSRDATDMAGSNTQTYTPAIDEDDPLEWAVDTDKLTDIADARD